MRIRMRMVAALVCVLGLVWARPVVSRTAEAPRLVVHEWGTFTSIAGEAGEAVVWEPGYGLAAVDLPCFVSKGPLSKVQLSTSAGSGTPVFVRMETPVLYFYSPVGQRINVNVGFPEGRITEWFPNATVGTGSGAQSRIEWRNVVVTPGPDPEYPSNPRRSHYYAARATDAAPLQVNNDTEKFLFYRGVGFFTPPVSAIVRQDDRIVVWNASGQLLGDVVLFQRRGDQTSFQVRHVLTPQTTFDAPVSVASGPSTSSGPSRAESRDGFSRTDAEGATSDVGQALEQILIANGLFAKEAAAMVNTWKDSWFEEGTHLYYIVPPATVDTLLPLDITPSPNDVQRVFVGRLELASRTTMQEIRTAVQNLDFVPVAKYGRFLAPFAERVIAERPVNDHKLLRQRIDWAIPASRPDNSSCGK